ncbi:MAG: DUF3772 domain-containing protein, partial [Pseudomonadota bacterium]|nr:DUF3772 domain-containing protein [Pseudomonadota bacterium]
MNGQSWQSRFARLGLLFLAWLSLGAPVFAQSAPPSPDALPAMATTVDQAQADLRVIAAGAHVGRSSDAELKAKMAALPPIQARLASVLAILTPRLADADARLAQLGPAPASGQPTEAQETADARRGVLHFRQAVNTEVVQARLLGVEADQLRSALAERLRRNFAARLWTRTRSIADPTLWRDFAAALPADLARLGRAGDDQTGKLAAAAKRPGA